MKLFPIQAEVRNEDGKTRRFPRLLIPWSVAEIAYVKYARRYGTQQSLERLAQRGGYGSDELLEYLSVVKNKEPT